MRVLKLGLISFAFLFIVVTVISLFIRSHIRISRAINIAGTKSDILNQLDNPQHWKNWYPGLDTSQLVYQNGVVTGVVIKKSPPASLVLTSKDSAKVLAEFRSARPTVVNGWNVIEHPQSDSLTVQWFMDIDLPWYPWEKFASLLFEKSYGVHMEQGLGRLKKIVQE